ncbi:hypothetical protein, partial [Rhizobium leguminosarum]|uniref:hypothetical protein n=1 Tax=Rhizobium leguminosarum TaxID=384 RepID=UPI003F97F762
IITDDGIPEEAVRMIENAGIRLIVANPNAKGVVLESHGLFTWADDAKACYELTLEIIKKAIVWFAEKTEGKTIFGGALTESLA